MKMAFRIIVAVTILIVGLSCSATVKRTTSNPDIRLRDYNKVAINLLSGTGEVSKRTTILGNLLSDEVDNRSVSVQDKMAFQSLQFQLTDIGFQVVSDTSQASAIVDFSLGYSKYDTLSGWVTNEAYLFFKECKTGQTLVGFHAQANAFTGWDRIKDIISKLMENIRTAY